MVLAFITNAPLIEPQKKLPLYHDPKQKYLYQGQTSLNMFEGNILSEKII